MLCQLGLLGITYLGPNYDVQKQFASGCIKGTQDSKHIGIPVPLELHKKPSDDVKAFFWSYHAIWCKNHCLNPKLLELTFSQPGKLRYTTSVSLGKSKEKK